MGACPRPFCIIGRLSLTLFATLPAVTVAEVCAAPTTAARVAREVREDRFCADRAGARFERILELVADSNAPALVGRERWHELVAKHRPNIVRARTHEQFARRVNDLIVESGTSHFQYFPDSDWSYWHLASFFGDEDRYEVAHIGLYPKRIDGRWFVAGVFEGSEAQRAGILVGDEIVAVDGAPYAPLASFRGKAGTTVTVRLQRRPGEFHDVGVTPVEESLYQAMQNAIVASIDVLERSGRRIAYMHGWTLLGGAHEYRMLRKLQGEVSGLILDYRDGYGGHWGAAERFLLGRDGGGSADNAWTKPVVILTGEGTRSAKEIVVDSVRRHARAPLVGLPTPGQVVSVGGVRRIGDDAFLELPGQRFRLEGHPTMPDFLVERVIPYCAGDDPQLDAAQALLSVWLDGDRTSQLGASLHEVVAPVR